MANAPTQHPIKIAPIAQAMIDAIPDARIKKKIAEAIEKLKNNPNQVGKNLQGKLSGLRSMRASSQRYRVIFKVATSEPFTVTVVAVGIRKEGSKQDAYVIAEKLAARGTL